MRDFAYEVVAIAASCLAVTRTFGSVDRAGRATLPLPCSFTASRHEVCLPGRYPSPCLVYHSTYPTAHQYTRSRTRCSPVNRGRSRRRLYWAPHAIAHLRYQRYYVRRRTRRAFTRYLPLHSRRHVPHFLKESRAQHSTTRMASATVRLLEIASVPGTRLKRVPYTYTPGCR